MAKNKVAIVGTGQTKHRSRRRDVNIPEMIYEATKMALDEAQLTPKDIDAVVIGNMDHFEGINFSEMWTGIEGAPGYLKPVVKVATGGTTGTSLAIYGYYAVASGRYNKVLVVGWEKLNEGGATTGIVTAFDPVWERPALAGALGPLALMASMYMWEYGVNNPFAHLQQPNMTLEEVMNSPVISWPMRLHDCCPQSEGACAIIYANEEEAKKITDNAAWVKAKVGIRDPVKDLDVAEVYEPCSWAELMWTEALGFCEYGEGGKLLDDGVTEMSGELPVSPSGGVLSTNPIGATALIRVAEAAIQVRGLGGKRQVPDVETALAHGFGGSVWADIVILGREP
ncbi:MAG: thiolase C-terminal domain-containing protein [Candidatus Freyarchaeota archaeon]